MPASHTPLRYPGGKSRLANFMKLVFLENGLCDGHYVEPFAGGAGLAITLLRHEYASVIHLNDINPAVFAFWKGTLDEPEALCKLIRDTPVTMDAWVRQQAVFKAPDAHDILTLGFATLFLNRTNRSGILGAGVIGGKGQTGKWKIDARFNKSTLIRKVQDIARYHNRVRIYNQDAAHFLRVLLPQLPAKSLVYLDPPYYQKGQDLYENHYRHQDHEEIYRVLAGHPTNNWVVSYDNAPEIRTIYRGCPDLCYGIGYSAHEHHEGSELMFFCGGLVVPETRNPIRESAKSVRAAVANRMALLL